MRSPPAPFRSLPSGAPEIRQATTASWRPGEGDLSRDAAGAPDGNAAPVAADAHGVEWRNTASGDGWCGVLVFAGFLGMLAWVFTPRTFDATVPVLLLRCLPAFLLAWMLAVGVRHRLARIRNRMRLLFEPERLHLVHAALFSSTRTTWQRAALRRVFLVHTGQDAALSGWFVLFETAAGDRHPLYHHADREPARWLADEVAAWAGVAVEEETTTLPIYEWLSPREEREAFRGAWRDAPCAEPEDLEGEATDEDALKRPRPLARPLGFRPLPRDAKELAALPRGWGPDEGQPFPAGTVAYRLDGVGGGWGCFTFVTVTLALVGWALLEETRAFFDPVLAGLAGLAFAAALAIPVYAFVRGGLREYLVLAPDALWYFRYRFRPRPGRRLRRDAVTAVTLRAERGNKKRLWTVLARVDGEEPLDLLPARRDAGDARWLAERVAAWAGVRPGLEGEGVLPPSSPLAATASQPAPPVPAEASRAAGEPAHPCDSPPEERLVPEPFKAMTSDALAAYWLRVAPPDAPPPAAGALGLADGTPQRLTREAGCFPVIWIAGVGFFTILLLPAWFQGKAHIAAPLFLLPFWLAAAFMLWRMLDQHRRALAFVFDGERLRIVARGIARRRLTEIAQSEIAEIGWRPPMTARHTWLADIRASGGAVSFLSGFKNGWRLMVVGRDGRTVNLMDHAFPLLPTHEENHPPWTWLGERVAAWAAAPFAPLRPGQAAGQVEWEEAIPPCFEALPPGSAALADVARHAKGKEHGALHPAAFGFRHRPLMSTAGKAGLTLFCAVWMGFVMFGLGGAALKAWRGDGSSITLFLFPLFALAGAAFGIIILQLWFKRIYFLFEPDRLRRLVCFWGFTKTTELARGDVTAVAGEPVAKGKLGGLAQRADLLDGWVLRVHRREGGPVDVMECESVGEAESPQIVWLGQQIAAWAELPFEDRLPPPALHKE